MTLITQALILVILNQYFKVTGKATSNVDVTYTDNILIMAINGEVFTLEIDEDTLGNTHKRWSRIKKVIAANTAFVKPVVPIKPKKSVAQMLAEVEIQIAKDEARKAKLEPTCPKCLHFVSDCQCGKVIKKEVLTFDTQVDEIPRQEFVPLDFGTMAQEVVEETVCTDAEALFDSMAAEQQQEKEEAKLKRAKTKFHKIYAEYSKLNKTGTVAKEAHNLSVDFGSANLGFIRMLMRQMNFSIAAAEMNAALQVHADREQQYWLTLGIAPNSDTTEVKKAYKRLAMQFHPDRTKGDKVKEEQFKAIKLAYEALK